ncbi:DNA-directed RNA polymerase [Zostera marina]|uniref:DNA-directed RNA polymerase subunit n=1 Tax=Zostera marina TaxID=29655 RepID=A0A0K9NU57_ZOSMR|nr:DNA-directed RNA polymerase [Zostera marina]
MAKKDGILKCTKELYLDDVGPRKIKSVKFSTFSGTEIRDVAEVEVWKSKFYDQNRDKVKNGLLDTHMGPSQKHHGACATCYGNHDECPGHFGYLNLAFPVYNVCYLNTVLTILKCICKSCARVLLPENQRIEFLKKMRNPNTEVLQKQACFKKIRDKCKASRCLRCGYINGAVKKARPGSLALVEDFNKVKDVNAEASQFALSHLNGKSPLNSRHALTADKVSGLLKKMIHEDCVLLNLNDNPEKFIVSVIPVPPVAVRPSVLVGNGKSQEDGISSMLREIIVTNNILKDLMNAGGPLEKCLDAWDLLQLQVAEYMNSEFPCVVDSKHRGFTQRIKGKQGRFRSNLCGKRTEFTGRTVISPDPNLKITEVGVPKQMAMVLTYPEIVSHHNIEKLRKCVRNGLYKYPGAKSVIHPDGSKINLKVANKTEANNLKYGYIVERHLTDGDVILFNRQPSLHRMSIMSHRAKVMPWRTLRFNESVCNPYNADFDGDEMNMHFPQTEEARTEALMLMGVQNNLCTPKNGEILVASTQDFLTSSFLITRKDTFYDRTSFSLMCHAMGDACEHIDLPVPSIIKPIELWTGKQLFSVLIRPNVDVNIFLTLAVRERGYTSGETMCINDGYVYFMNSDLICGQLGKSTLGEYLIFIYLPL